jgi:hypothetical protein
MNNSNRLILILFYVSYAVSITLLLIASISRSPLPAWGGYLDVGIAFLIAILGFVIFGRAKDNPQYRVGHRAALNIIPIILLGMWILRNTFDFNILLPGLAWRAFFFLHILPYGVNLWNPQTSDE